MKIIQYFLIMFCMACALMTIPLILWNETLERNIEAVSKRTECLLTGHDWNVEECEWISINLKNWHLMCDRCSKRRIAKSYKLTTEDCDLIEEWCGLRPVGGHAIIEDANDYSRNMIYGSDANMAFTVDESPTGTISYYGEEDLEIHVDPNGYIRVH